MWIYPKIRQDMDLQSGALELGCQLQLVPAKIYGHVTHCLVSRGHDEILDCRIASQHKILHLIPPTLLPRMVADEDSLLLL